MSINTSVLLIRALLLAFFLATSTQAEDSQRPFVFEPEVQVPMRDGVRLVANVFLPKGAGPWPVILYRNPYGKGGEEWPGAQEAIAKGYVTVVQDCRGSGKSEGVWEPFRHEAQDGFDTLEWVGKQTWCNGNIGFAGGSYLGFTQWAAAPNASRYLRAMVPLAPFGNAYDTFSNSGGAMMLGLLMGWGELVGGLTLDSDQLHQSYRYLPLQSFGDQFKKNIPYLNEWVRHPTYDDFWKQRGIDYRYADVTVPTLNVSGWYDIFSQETLDLTTGVRASSRNPQARTNQFVIIGPWAHSLGGRKTGDLDFGSTAELDIHLRQSDWFEYWLKGRRKEIHDWPPYYLFIMGENCWRGEKEWPLKRTRFTPYYLRSAGQANTLKGDGSLSPSRPRSEPPDEYSYDGDDPVPTVGGNNLFGATAGPRDQSQVEERYDVLVYSTLPLEKDVEVTGPVKLILWASSSASDTDFTGKLVDVHPDGKAYNLCDGILRARYRNGRNKAVLLEPGKPQRFEIDLGVTSNRFKRGHRVRLEVSSSNFPRFDRNPNSGQPFGTDTEMLTARQTVFHDSKHPSHLLLPIIPQQ